MKYFITVQFLKLLNLRICKYFDIYSTSTVSSSAHPNNLEPMKTLKPIKSGLFENPGLKYKFD